MNKKGFTLIELLTVIILISVIATLSFQVVSTSISEAKERNYETLIATFKSAAKKYLLEEDQDSLHVDVLCISLKDLQGKGFLELGNIKNPKTGNNFNLENDGITAKYNDSTKQYDLQLYTNNNCTISTNNTTLYDQIIDDEIDDLYETNDTYVYRGSSVNNYIKIGSSTFRIVNLDKDTKSLKVIDLTGDSSTSSDLTNSINLTYIGNDNQTGSYDSIKEYISESSKWNSGTVNEIGSYKSVLSQEKSSNTYQTINLLTLSDYIESKLNGETYLPTNKSYWLMTKDTSGKNWYVNNTTVNSKLHSSSDTYYKLPVFYLKSNVQYVSGDGSSGSPYQITINEDQDN